MSNSVRPYEMKDMLRVPLVTTLETSAGTLFLRNGCTPDLVEHLKADPGLKAFTRRAEREYELLMMLAQRSDSNLTLAYTPGGEIVGEVALAPADSWWQGLGQIKEIAVQVSSRWRRLGIASNLLALALEQDYVEDWIIIALGFSWHWDLEGLGLTSYRYRQLIGRLFAHFGFAEYLTSEPNIREDPANVFLARIGRQVKPETMDSFFSHLLFTEIPLR